MHRAEDIHTVVQYLRLYTSNVQTPAVTKINEDWRENFTLRKRTAVNHSSSLNCIILPNMMCKEVIKCTGMLTNF